MDDKTREALLRKVGKHLGLDDDFINKVVANPPRTREQLAQQIWESFKKYGKPDYTADPIYVSRSPFNNDSLTFERKQYGNAIVIEADGIIVERLCGDTP